MKFELRLVKVSVICLWIALLNGCGTLSHRHDNDRDGPPLFDVDVAKIPDAVPKVEPYSKYGNPPSYVAKGQRYYTLKNSIGFEERGIASWYGTKFYKRRTSSGEPYNLLAMTAAHRTLPLPTYMLVTNLENGRHVIVKVNDRGPFAANRIMDLSYVAAKKLGITAHGTGLVDIKAIDPKHPQLVLSQLNPSYISTQPSTVHAVVNHPHLTATPRLYLQLGAFAALANARRLATKVAAQANYPVRIDTMQQRGHNLYRVQIGPLPSVDTSDALLTKLQVAGLGKPFTVIQ